MVSIQASKQLFVMLVSTRYFGSFLDAIGAKIKVMHQDVKRDFGIIVSKKFYDRFKYLLILNRIVGLFPISITIKGESYSLQWSWMKVISGNFFVFIFAMLIVTGVVTSYNIDEVYNVRLKGLSALICTTSEVVTLLSTWLIGQVSISLYFKEFWKYLLCLIKADEIIGPVEPSSKRPFLIVTIFTLTFICLGLDIYMWSDIVVPIVGPFNFAWQVVPFYFTYVFTMILEVNIWIAVCELTARIRKLDNIMEGTLKKLNNLGVSSKFLQSDLDPVPIRWGVLPKKQMDPCKAFTPHAVRKIICAYDNIVMASLSFNNLYGPSLMILLVNVIACLVLTPYVLYQQILNAKEYGFLFTQSYWMTCHVLRLLFFIQPCHDGHKQALRLKRTTVKLAATDWPRDVHKQVKLLLRQVAENKIEFNAAGLTCINRTLLPTIGSAVFTYLAILFQYKNNT